MATVETGPMATTATHPTEDAEGEIAMPSTMSRHSLPHYEINDMMGGYHI